MSSDILKSSFSEKNLRTISILVVSETYLTNKLKESISNAYKSKYEADFKLLVIKANYIQDILTLKIPIDFIVFVVDLSLDSNVDKVRNDLKFLDESFFIGKICIVNATNFIENAQQLDLLALSEQYKIPLFNTDIRVTNKCKLIGERILRLVNANLLHKIPFVPWASAF